MTKQRSSKRSSQRLLNGGFVLLFCALSQNQVDAEPKVNFRIWTTNPEKEAATPEGQQLNRGFAKMSRGYWEDAAADFDSCSEFKNVTEQAITAIANDYAQIGRHDKALSIFNMFLKRQPPGKPFDKTLRASTYRVRANCYRDINRFPEACADYLKAAELSPPEIGKNDLEQAAELCRKLKKYPEALALFERAAPSKYPGFYHHRGLLYEELGKPEQAISDFSTSIRMILEVRKKNGEAYGFVLRKLYEYRADAYDRVGKKEQAAADRRAIQTMSKNWADDLLTPPDAIGSTRQK